MVMDSGASVKWSWKMYKKIKNNKKKPSAKHPAQYANPSQGTIRRTHSN